MEITVTPKKETSQVEITVTILTATFSPYLEKAARKLSQEAPIKGFRPGKVPLSVAREQYGTERLLQKAIDTAIPHFFVEAVLEKDIEAINRPQITVEELGFDLPLRFKAVVDTLPEVSLPDTLSLPATGQPIEVKNDAVEHELSQLARMRSTFTEVAREAKTGDTVTIDFSISIDGQVIEGGSSKNHPVQLGEGHFLPSFEEGLVGVKAGEDKTFALKFPADYGQEALRDKEAQVQIHVHTVQERSVPEITDQFAQGLGKFSDLAHLKLELKKGIAADKEQKEDDRYKAELAEKLAEQATFGHIPDILVEQEISHRLQEFAQMLSYQQRSVEDYMHQQQKTIQDMRTEMRPTALKNVKIGLAVRAFAKKHDITVSDEEVAEEMNKHVRQYASLEEAAKHVNIDELREEATSLLRNRKSLAELQKIAKKK